MAGEFHERVARSISLRALTLVIFAFELCLGVVGGAHAADAAREDQFKAAYLFNFVKFVEWPDFVRADELTVCFIGADRIRTAFSADLDSKRAGSRRIVVKQLDATASIETCNALYVDQTGSAQITKTLAKTTLPILTVSDAKAFSTDGGVIELFTDNNKLRFNINLDQEQHAGLRISSNLLQLAASVGKGGGR